VHREGANAGVHEGGGSAKAKEDAEGTGAAHDHVGGRRGSVVEQRVGLGGQIDGVGGLVKVYIVLEGQSAARLVSGERLVKPLRQRACTCAPPPLTRPR
jgi:hypothetical protein